MKHYEVIVKYDPHTLRRLDKPKVFKHDTQEEALAQASYLRKQGLKKRHFDIYVREND